MTAKAQDRRALPGASPRREVASPREDADTLVGHDPPRRAQITGEDLLAPTLHASPGGAPADLLTGTILDGVYRVEKEIGRGAMGTVYVVEHLRLGRKFAAKVVSTRHAENSEIASRLSNEARVASRVQHENIVDVTHLGQTPSGALFIVMELLAGRDLRELMRAQIESDGPRWLPDALIRSLVADVMAGLGAAHAAGIVHRDLKPDNIFVIEGPQRVRAKIVDFGISWSPSSEDLGLTRDGQIIGTPLYMAPEQARGGPAVDARADLYALGVVCHELLTGALPFDATSVFDMIVKHATEPPPPLRRARPELPAALEEVVLRSLAKKPEDRFQTVAEMRDAWEAAWLTTPQPTASATPDAMPGLVEVSALPPEASQAASIAEEATSASQPRAAKIALGLAVLGLLAIAAFAFSPAESASIAVRPVIDGTPPADPSPSPPQVDPLGTEVEVAPELPPAHWQRLITTEPAGATVSIGGHEVGTTPYSVDVDGAPVPVELRLRGYRREGLSVATGSSEAIHVALRRARDAPPELAPR